MEWRDRLAVWNSAEVRVIEIHTGIDNPYLHALAAEAERIVSDVAARHGQGRDQVRIFSTLHGCERLGNNRLDCGHTRDSGELGEIGPVHAHGNSVPQRVEGVALREADTCSESICRNVVFSWRTVARGVA